VIDASVLIRHERSGEEIGERLVGREDEESFISVVAASELLHGVRRAATEAIRVRRSAFVEGLLQRYPILGIDLATARVHARIWASLAAAGTPVGAHDLWIAASCLAHGFSLVTLNVRELERVPGLRIENWS
jgi:tRNA(fMet)-specific endonuclease VapC